MTKLCLQVMERGKLLQERQSDVDELKAEVENKEVQMKSLVDDFNRKKDLVDSNLKVCISTLTFPTFFCLFFLISWLFSIFIEVCVT